MSAISDQFEAAIAQAINSYTGMVAVRPSADTRLSDVAITHFKGKLLPKRVWVEVKMSHADNLSNPRVFYKGGRWGTTYKTPTAQVGVDLLNSSEDTKKFIRDLARFSGIPVNSIQVPTSKSGLKEPGAVPLSVMKAFFDQPGVNRYIAKKSHFDIGKLVIEHYTLGKAEPAHYLQAGDDFYMISSANPLKLIKGIPLLAGTGDFKVRVSTRSEFYEVQAEIKIAHFTPPTSPFSVKSGTTKKNPFL